MRYVSSNTSLNEDDDTIEFIGKTTVWLPIFDTFKSTKEYTIINSGNDVGYITTNENKKIYDVRVFEVYPGESILIQKGRYNWLVK